ncbi:MAG: hypothetical protein R2706_05960 [Acidimicrobiales bacterium]
MRRRSTALAASTTMAHAWYGAHPPETGRLEADLRIITGEETTATFPVVSWLVIHPDGVVL